MDHGAKQEQWRHTGDVCYAVAQSQSKAKIDRHAFDRYEQQVQKQKKSNAPKVKPSDVNFG